MAKETFKVCAKYVGTVQYNEKDFARFTVVGTGSFIHIPIDHIKIEMRIGSFYLVDVYPRHYEDENYLSFNLRCELSFPRADMTSL